LRETEQRLQELTSGTATAARPSEDGLVLSPEAPRLNEAQFRSLFAASMTGIAISTPQGRFLEVNKAYCAMLGYTEAELRGRDFGSVTHPDDLPLNLKMRDELLSGRRDSFVMEKRYVRKNGDILWTRHSVSAARAAGGDITTLIVIAQDITERRLTEFRLNRLNRLHTVLSKVGEAVIRTSSRHELYDAVCRIIVEHGSLRMAFVAEVDAEASQARPVASFGEGLDYLREPMSAIRTDGGPSSRGTVGTVVRTGAHDMCNDIRADPRMRPWREAALRSGLLANASFPLKLNGSTVAVLALYAGETDYFRDDEIGLMVSVANTISFALEGLEKERQRLAAESRLRESEARLRIILQALEAGVIAHGPDSRITAVNAKALKLLELSESQVISRPAFAADWHLVRRDGSPMTEAELPYSRSVAGRLPVRDSVMGMIRAATGNILWLLVSANPVLTDEGEIGEVIITFMDVTAQIHAEQALEESESRYRALVEWSPEAIAVQRDGKLLFINPAGVKMMGAKSADELIGKSTMDLVHPDSREMVAERVRRGNQGDRAQPMVEEKLIRLDGTTIDVEIQGTPITYDGKHALYSSMRDITEHKRIEARFRRLVESNAQGVFFWNAKGEVTGGNDAFLRLVGYSREDLEAGRVNWIAMTPPEYGHNDERSLGEISVTKASRTYEKEYIRKDGTRVPILIGAAIFEDDPEEGVCFVVDLTERKELEQQLLQSQKMESLGQLTGGIAHDFNNLLGIIQLSLELLRERLANDLDANQMVAMALGATERGASLTHRLLAFARQQPLEPKSIDIGVLLSEMASLLNRTLGENIEIKTAAPFDLWMASADPHQLENALLNLAVNASHAMPDGGKLTIGAANKVFDSLYIQQNVDVLPGEYVAISVSDTGSGIPAEILDRILEPFFTTKPVGKGSGLGLSMVHGFAKQSNGNLKIYSEVGYGTTVNLYLPRASIDVGHVPAARGPEIMASTGGEVILVVEDDPDLRDLTPRILEGLGYRTITAEDGPDACLLLDRTDHIDLLLTDVILPKGINGPDIARHGTLRKPGLKVLFMSGYPSDAVLRDGLLENGMRLLSKPFPKAELARLVRQLLDERDDT
jgi:PAS domain S-box-containing protein